MTIKQFLANFKAHLKFHCGKDLIINSLRKSECPFGRRWGQTPTTKLPVTYSENSKFYQEYINNKGFEKLREAMILIVRKTNMPELLVRTTSEFAKKLTTLPPVLRGRIIEIDNKNCATVISEGNKTHYINVAWLGTFKGAV